MTRPDVAQLAQQTRAAKAGGADVASAATVAPLATSPTPAGMPSVMERVAILRDASGRAAAASLAPGVYVIADGLHATWDGAQFRNPRVA